MRKADSTRIAPNAQRCQGRVADEEREDDGDVGDGFCIVNSGIFTAIASTYQNDSYGIFLPLCELIKKHALY